MMVNQYFWNFPTEYRDLTAVICEKGLIHSYGQLDRDITEFQSKLSNERVLAFLKVSNDYDSVVAYLACLRAKQPFVLLDADIPDDTLAALLDRYNPNLIIAKTICHYRHDNDISMNKDLALMMSTSGSTGEPKLVKLSYENISVNAKAIAEYLAIPSTDSAITTLPLAYSYGLSIVNSHLCSGASIALNEHSIVSREFWNTVKAHSISTFAGVPFTFQTLRKLRYERFDTSSIRYLTQAGGALDRDTAEYFYQKCLASNQQFIVMYGQTEAAPRISYVPFGAMKNKIGSIGIPVPGGKLTIESEEGDMCQPGVEGEIVYQGPNVMMGYAENIQHLSLGDVMSGCLRTGDIGYQDSDGFTFITGRVKRFLKLYGLRISLDRIESWMAENNIPGFACGNDEKLYICYENELGQLINLKEKLSFEFKLNANAVIWKQVTAVPRLGNGKTDYAKLLNLVSNH